MLHDLSKEVTELPQVNSCISRDSDQLQQVFSNQEASKGKPNTHIYRCKGYYSHNMSSSPTSNPPKEFGTLFLIFIYLAATTSRQRHPRTRRAGWVSGEVTPNLRAADVLDANTPQTLPQHWPSAWLGFQPTRCSQLSPC